MLSRDRRRNLKMATLTAVIALVPLVTLHALRACVVAALVTLVLRSFYRRWVGGVTGDLIGAAGEIRRDRSADRSYVVTRKGETRSCWGTRNCNLFLKPHKVSDFPIWGERERHANGVGLPGVFNRRRRIWRYARASGAVRKVRSRLLGCSSISETKVLGCSAAAAVQVSPFYSKGSLKPYEVSEKGYSLAFLNKEFRDSSLRLE